MKGLISTSHDPAFNLATEEFLLKNRNEDLFFLYINKPSIIAGKHQNVLAEINYKATQKHNINVYRRLSGGGTVYHDLGNINFCFISNTKQGEFIDFRHNSSIIAKSLEKTGLKPTIGKRNDISIDGLKISGNASHVFKNRSLHHGTLLFDSNLQTLNECLNNDYQKYSDKAVKSVKSEVTNIINHLKVKLSINEFINHIYNDLDKPDDKKISLTEDDILTINKLATTKYNTWEWNYGYSPEYQTTRTITIQNSNVTLDLEMTINKGIIEKLKIKNNQTDNEIEAIFRNLIGQHLKPNNINKILYEPLKSKFNISEPQDIINDLF